MLLHVVSCHIHKRFDLFLHHGPQYSYYPNPSECCVIVDSSCRDCAVQIFSPLGVQVVSSHCFLVGFLGDISTREEFVSCKVHQWISDVTNLAQLVVPQPQAAFATLTRTR